jgi:hypothetical protein
MQVLKAIVTGVGILGFGRVRPSNLLKIYVLPVYVFVNVAI